jgi:hypothetical protein
MAFDFALGNPILGSRHPGAVFFERILYLEDVVAMVHKMNIENLSREEYSSLL